MPTALLVIDVQQALCTGEYAAHDAAGLLARINQVSAVCRAAGAPVVFIQHGAVSGPLQPGTPGWELAEGLVVQVGDTVLPKRTPDSFQDTGLQALLQRSGVDHLVVCGLQSQFCVDTTTRRALALGYPVTLVSDGHATCDGATLSATQIRDHHSETLAAISSFGPRVTLRSAADLRL